jgi:hypothetical protein
VFPAVVVLFVLLGGVAEAAQDFPVDSTNEPARTLKEGKVLRAARIGATPPAIDGSLTDEVWTTAESAGNYVQRDPDNGAAMTEATRIQVAYDDRYIYIAILCEDGTPGSIAAGLGRRDELPSTDYVSIGFDPRHDHLTGYVFRTNPSAVQADFALTDDDREDRDYNAVWEVRTQIGERGWIAEFRIPFSQMRFAVSPAPGQVWGFQAERWVRRKGERGTWVAKPRGERGEVSLFGHLVFDTPLAASRRVELVPYSLMRGERDGTPDEGTTSDFGAALGADARIGLGSAATLAATVNPDFGQVEQDPAVLNLSVFETFYPEKRPFFLEDSSTFVPPYGFFQLFHSRRIGRTPTHFTVDSDDEIIERPDDTTILGAAKVTGKSALWTYGTLTALTGREHAIAEKDSGERYDHVAEPLTSYNVARLQRDVLGGSSNVGVLATGVFRDEADDAFTGGIDYNLRWDQNRVNWNGHWVATHAPGDGGVRTSGGGLTNFGVSRKHWNLFAHADHFGRDFRITDIGFFRSRANRNDIDGGFAVEQPDPGRLLRRYWVNICGGRAWNTDGLVFDKWLCTNGNVSVLNFWYANGGFTRRFETYDDLDTRGGPPILSPSGFFYYFNAGTDSRKSWRVNFGGYGNGGARRGTGRGLYANISLQPSGQLQLSVATRYEKGLDVAQWIKNTDTTGDGVDDHIYGTLRRNVVDITLRGTYSIHRDLTLQAYLQPFVAVGDYENIRRLARPLSHDFEPAVIDSDPDFNRKSVRGNVVLRWEYVRGSTLFLVWDVSQEDTRRAGVFRPARDLSDAFGAPSKHVLMAKVTYWLNR